MEWIRVKDKLPENNEECLVAFDLSPEYFILGKCYHLCIYQEEKFHTWELSKIVPNVTHWMPLPKPPSEKG